jgi:hypothetical protein
MSYDKKDLKSCPFCGSLNLSDADDDKRFEWIECSDCGARGPKTTLWPQAAKGFWNTRTQVQLDKTKCPNCTNCITNLQDENKRLRENKFKLEEKILTLQGRVRCSR